MIADEHLVGDVSDELFWDPKVHAEAIAVDAEDGKVTMRGTVGSPREKYEAKKAVERVRGVVSVENKLQVRLMDHQRRGDAELRADVLQALMLDALVPDTIDEPSVVDPPTQAQGGHVPGLSRRDGGGQWSAHLRTGCRRHGRPHRSGRQERHRASASISFVWRSIRRGRSECRRFLPIAASVGSPGDHPGSPLAWAGMTGERPKRRLRVGRPGPDTVGAGP